MSPGTLYIVATPIGNLEDISARALRILSNVDLIAAEDTRKTKILLNHYNITNHLVSYHNYNERERSSELLEKLQGGFSIAVVSDAGTPGISDPAYRIVKDCIDHSIPVVPIPGPSAFLPALIISGLPLDKFVFEGFLPHKKGRRTRLEVLARESHTIVLYESPHRLLRTLCDLQTHLGDRYIIVARELTKKFEEVLRGKVSDMIHQLASRSIKGEFVILISPKNRENGTWE